MKACKVGVAFGGGGARGMAHLLIIDVLERLGIKPSLIAGTSMGAIAGALYASGNHGKSFLNDLVKSLLYESAEGKAGRKIRDGIIRISDALKLFAAHKFDLSIRDYFSITRMLEQMFTGIEATRFEDLIVPFKAVTVDFWTAEEYVIDKGPLIPAIRASLAFPVLFTPVEVDNRLLVDGGLMNNVPWTILDDCDFIIAVDVRRKRSMNEGKRKFPNLVDTITGTIDIMCEGRVQRDLKNFPPSLYVWLEIEDVGLLEFNKVDSVIEQARPQVEKMEREIQDFFPF